MSRISFTHKKVPVGRSRASTSALPIDSLNSEPFQPITLPSKLVQQSSTPNGKRRSGIFNFRSQSRLDKEEIPPEPDTSQTYLKITTSFSLSTSNKKKKLYKPSTITVTSTRITFEKKELQPILLTSLCILQPTQNTILTKKKEELEEIYLLICDSNLTRLWINFPTLYECKEWVLIIDGILSMSNSSLLTKEIKVNQKLQFLVFYCINVFLFKKTDLLKEIYFDKLIGGTIKVGDYEEWSYIRNHKEMTCILSDGNSITGIKFHYDGLFLLPGENNHLGAGEWDGINIYWYTAGIPDIEDSNLRKKYADMSFHWIPFQEEFRPLHGINVIDDSYNTWKWARQFITRKRQSAHDWVQKEGDVPLPITMFLCMYKWASVTDPPPMQVLTDSEDEDEEE